MIIKLLYILDRNDKIKISTLFIVMLGVLFLEMLGIALVIPFVSIVLSENSLILNKFEIKLNFFDNFNRQQIITYSSLLLIFIFFIKSLLLIFTNWLQSRYLFDLQAKVSLKIFNYYLRYQPYLIHVNRNSSELIRNINGIVASTIMGYMNSLLIFILEFFILFSISIFLFIYEPAGFMFCMTLFITCTALFYYITKLKIKNMGIQSQIHDKGRLKSLFEGLNALKEIRILRREKKFFDDFSYHIKKAFNISVITQTIGGIPRIGLEFLAISVMASLVIFLNYRETSNTEIISILSLFAVAAFRIMPGINKLVSNLQTLNFNQAGLNFLYDEVKALNQYSDKNLPVKSKIPIDDFSKISISKLNFKYTKDNSIKILKDITFDINRNETVGIIGPSGSGKSTLVNLIMGLFQPSSGGIFLDQKNIEVIKYDYQNLIGYVSQSIFLTDDTIRNNIALGIEEDDIDNNRLNESIKLSQLSHFINSLTDKEYTFVGERGARISGGEQQRIGIARALYHNPKILVLDEATSSLDSITEKNIIDDVISNFKGKLTMIIVSHRKAPIKNCDKVIKILDGEIILKDLIKELE